MYLIEEQESLDHFLSDIKNEECIGVDTEFARVKTYYPKLCWVQIATPSLIACIDCLSDIDLNGLWEIIFDENIEKIMHSCSQDIEIFFLNKQDVPQNIFDTQIALISATVLTYNIVGHQNDPDYLLYLVDELSESKYPHQIPNSYEFAQIQVEKLASVISKVKKSMKVIKNLGHMEILDSGASGAVNFVLGLSGKDVGVAYKERVDYGIYAVSVRGSKSCKVHLGKIVNRLATEVGGSGGGHDKACGASIPKANIKKFIKNLNSELEK